MNRRRFLLSLLGGAAALVAASARGEAEPATVYKLFFPTILGLTPKGLALTYGHTEDVAALDCAWYYNWSTSGGGAEFVPMSWSGTEIPPQTSGYCLVFNEPENADQANVSPAVALTRLQAIYSARPNLKLIVGGCGVGGRSWMDAFMAINTVPVSGYHIHGYIEPTRNLATVVDYWTYIRSHFPGELWVTEFADVWGIQLGDLLNSLRTLQVERYAYFTNRLLGTETWYPPLWPRPQVMSLCDYTTGSLTTLGSVYKGEPFVI